MEDALDESNWDEKTIDFDNLQFTAFDSIDSAYSAQRNLLVVVVDLLTCNLTSICFLDFPTNNTVAPDSSIAYGFL